MTVTMECLRRVTGALNAAQRLSKYAKFDPSKHPKDDLGRWTKKRSVASDVFDGETGENFRAKATEWARRELVGKRFTNKATGMEIQVSSRSIKKTLNHLPDKRPALALSILPELIESAVLDHQEPDRHDTLNVKAWHYLKAALQIYGQPHVTTLKIREDANGIFYYDQNVSLQTKVAPPCKLGAADESAVTPAGGAKKSIDHDHSAGKQDSDDVAKYAAAPPNAGLFDEAKHPRDEAGKFAGISDAELFKRSGQQFENLQTAMGHAKPVMGTAGADRVRDWLTKHPAGPVVEALLGVDGTQTSYDRNGFAERGMDAYRQVLDRKFTKPQLDAAANWLHETFNNSKELANVNQHRWLHGEVRTSIPRTEESKPAATKEAVSGQQQGLFDRGEFTTGQKSLFNVIAPGKPKSKASKTADLFAGMAADIAAHLKGKATVSPADAGIVVQPDALPGQREIFRVMRRQVESYASGKQGSLFSDHHWTDEDEQNHPRDEHGRWAHAHAMSRGEFHQQEKVKPGYDVSATNKTYWAAVKQAAAEGKDIHPKADEEHRQIFGEAVPRPAAKNPAGYGPELTEQSTHSGIKPEKSSESPAVAKMRDSIKKKLVEDFGEKIGGARKDNAKKLGPRGKKGDDANDERPAWTRRYDISQIAKSSNKSEEGKWSITDTKDKSAWGIPREKGVFSSKEEAEAALPLIAASRNHRVNVVRGNMHEDNREFAIVRNITDRKRAVVKGGFKSEDEANRYMATHAAEIIEHQFPRYEDYAYLDHVERHGPEHKTLGKDVTPADFQKAFQFRGGEFGNWQSGKDGVTSLNHAYDALHDLSDALGLPAKSVALNGDLAIAFGARGTGGKNSARAHYEPDARVMNLTKMKGAGSLAHEWSHALDWHLGNGEHAISDPSYKTKLRPEVADAAKSLRNAMNGKQIERAIQAPKPEVDEVAELKAKYPDIDVNTLRVVGPHTVAGHLHNLKGSMNDSRRWKAERSKRPLVPLSDADNKEWDELSEKIASGDVGARMIDDGGRQTYENVDRLNKLHKRHTGRSFHTGNWHDPSVGHYIVSSIERKQLAEKRAKEADDGVVEKRTVPTDFATEAIKLDSIQVGNYYSLPHEMFARAFEAYVADKLHAKGIRSDYLVSRGKTDNRSYAMYGLKPFPEGEERKNINAAFDQFFATLKHQPRDDDKVSHVQLYSCRHLVASIAGIIERYSADIGSPEYATEQLRSMGINPSSQAAVDSMRDFIARRLAKDRGESLSSRENPFAAFIASKPKKASQPNPGKKSKPANGRWIKVGGSSVFVGNNGRIEHGCPGLKGHNVSDLVNESDESRDRRDAKQAHAESRGLTGRDLTASQANKFATKPMVSQHQAAKQAAKGSGVATSAVLARMPDAEQLRNESTSRLEEMKADFRKTMKMNAGTLAKIENSYRDHSTVPHFDEAVASLQQEYPDLNFGDDPADFVWQTVRQGKQAKPTHSEIADEAAKMVATSKPPRRGSSRAEQIAAVVSAAFDDSFNFGANAAF